VGERTRIARDLHDTLLQSFHGLMLRLQVVHKLLPEGKAKEQLENTMERADQAIAEGRNAVYDLRSSATLTNDLSEALDVVGNELSVGNEAAFTLVVEGSPRDLHPRLWVMLSSTRTPAILKSKTVTENGSSGCESGTMARAFQPKF
jgi:signal transduction histidine kinase